MKLKKICSEKGIDLKKLSEKTGISLTYLYELERGSKENPSLKVIKSISDALGLQINDLLNVV